MRTPRIKVPANEGTAVYHVITRVVNGERLIDDVGREVLRNQLWQVAEYCAAEILTYAILSNHFHVLLRIPQFTSVSDEELLRRYRALYPDPTRYQQVRLEVIEERLKANGPDAERWRQRQLAQMHDVSAFMRLLKQRYTIWHNDHHDRFGTLWAERFKSVLVEPDHRVIETIATYIDLNPVRAGLVTDPKDYRFCGYAEAVAGNEKARTGLCSVFGRAWGECQSHYRQVLFAAGSDPRENAQVISKEQFDEVVRAGGKLPLCDVLRCRVRYFSDGAVLGTQAFVSKHLEDYRKRTGWRLNRDVHEVPVKTDWGILTALRPPRGSAFG